MSDEVVLRLKVGRFKEALKIVERIKIRVREVVSDTQRAQAATKEDADETRRKQRKQRSRAWKSTTGVEVQQNRFGARLGSVGSAHERVTSLFDAVNSRSVGSIASAFAEFAPGALGPMLAVAGPLVDRLMAYVDERIEIQAAVIEARTQALLDEERFRRDYSRRLAEDAEFERTQARKGYEQFRREEAVFGKRIERLDLLEGL